MSLVGPLTSLLIGGLSFVLWTLIGRAISPLAAILGYLATANILLGLFNLLPGFPLDGGRVLRSIIWKISGSLSKATRVATLVGQVMAYLFILGGIWLFFGGNLFSGLWIWLSGMVFAQWSAVCSYPVHARYSVQRGKRRPDHEL